MTERWLPVVGFEGLYEISSAGSVRSLDREVRTRDGQLRNYIGKTLNLSTTKKGYKSVTLGRSGGTHLVHRLVALAFLGEPEPGQEVCHGDGDPTNNRVENLRWDTQSGNMFDRVRHGTHHQAIKIQCRFGHKYDQLNTLELSNNRRDCRECRNRRNREYRRRKNVNPYHS